MVAAQHTWLQRGLRSAVLAGMLAAALVTSLAASSCSVGDDGRSDPAGGGGTNERSTEVVDVMPLV